MNYRIGLLFYFLSTLLYPQNSRLWPTDAGKTLSSNFGEYRSDHYHMGLDIKAGAKPGAKVFAVDDGYVSRIVTNFGGYGQALYVTTKDGKTAVYAHLKSYNAELEEVLRVQQQKAKSYIIDQYFTPREFPVTRGDVLGLVGNRGYSFGRHLHFEIRNADDQPLNPFLNGFSIPDQRPPQFRKLAVIPLDSGATINAGVLPRTLPLFFDRSGIYLPPDTINATGPFGLAVETVDKVQGVNNVYQIYRLALKVDGKIVFQKKLQRLDYATGRRVNLDRDYRLYRLNLGSFQRLFEHPGNTNSATENGILNLLPGLHDLEIEAADVAGNIATARIMVRISPLRNLTVKLLNKGRDFYHFQVIPDTLLPLHKLTCYSYTAHGYADLKEDIRIKTRSDGSWDVAVPAGRCQRNALQFIGQLKGGYSSYPVQWIPEKLVRNVLDSQVKLRTDPVEDGVFLQIEIDRIVAPSPVVYLYSDQRIRKIPVRQIQPTVFISDRLKPVIFDQVKKVEVKLTDGQERITNFSVLPRYVAEDRRTEVYSPDHNCSMLIQPGALFYETVAWIDKIESPVKPRSGKRLSPVYQLQPFDVPLKEPISVGLKYPDTERLTTNMAVFSFDSKDEKWIYVPTKRKPGSPILIGKMESLEAVTILKDTLAPWVEFSFPAQDGRYKAGDVETIRGRFADDLADIQEDEKGIRVQLDGARLLGAYQPVKKVFSYDLNAPLSPGMHTLIWTLLDQTGNRGRKTIHFTIE
ncbi:MAG: M23 family metallopeptidase [FCB group bacterium]|nr:M23 family metallopeptidase [FCB group bacterium]